MAESRVDGQGKGLIPQSPHFWPTIDGSVGVARIAELREALGAFLIYQAGYPTIEMRDVRELEPGEVWTFAYKGHAWRFSFIMGYDVRTHARGVIKVHFDNLGRAAGSE